MIRSLLIFLIIICGSLKTFAQRETDNWYFGQNASLEFNAAGLPVSFQNSAMNTTGGCASISDRSGNLLFYTNGVTVWNRLHQIMTNGSGLHGNAAAAQSCIIIPKPGSTSLYYIIYQQDQIILGSNRPAILKSSLVDISAQNGMGEVVNSDKNIVIYTPLPPTFMSQKLTAVHHGNNQEIWLITHRFPNPFSHEFLSFKITAAGIQTSPVLSQINYQSHWYAGQGVLKASPTGNKLAGIFEHGCILFDFNNKTGSITNPIALNTSGSNSVGLVGVLEFSPDGSKLYTFNNNNRIEQYNLNATTAAAIIASRTDIAPVSGSFNFYISMQLASNGKIYVGRLNTNNLSEIANPNVAGAGCNFRSSISFVSSGPPNFKLPNFIQSYFAPPRFEYSGICAESPITFTIPNQANIDSVRWDFGDPTSIFNKSTALQPNHTFAAPGAYTVQLNIFQQGFHSVFERIVTILNKPLVQLPKDTSVCEGTVVFLMNSYPTNPFNERLLWSTGSRDSAMIKVTQPGIYWLELTNGFCTTRDSIVIKHRPKPKVYLGGNRTQCGNAPLILDAGNPGAKYLWQPDNETTQTIAVTKPGTYSVIVTSNRCSASDIVNINFNSYPGFDFGEDISVCEGEPVILKTVPEGSGVFYTWSDSSTKAELQVKKSGKYWATVKQNGCLFTDTVNVTFRSCPPPIVPYIPNIISPNNDNQNDKFVIEKIPLDAWALKIFNRWGKLIYTTDRYNNNWPDKVVGDGTYYYLLEEPETGRKFKGWVEVVK